MQKIDKTEVLNHPEFSKANEYLKNKVMSIVHKYSKITRRKTNKKKN